MAQNEEDRPDSYPPNLLLWLAIGSMALILAVALSDALFSPDGAFNPRPAILEVEKTGHWNLQERLNAACETGRLPPEKCGRGKKPVVPSVPPCWKCFPPN